MTAGYGGCGKEENMITGLERLTASKDKKKLHIP